MYELKICEETKTIPERKVIQISSHVRNGEQRIVALCDDGTIWWKGYLNDWAQIDPVPGT